jgi:hypothetical protein
VNPQPDNVFGGHETARTERSRPSAEVKVLLAFRSRPSSGPKRTATWYYCEPQEGMFPLPRMVGGTWTLDQMILGGDKTTRRRKSKPKTSVEDAACSFNSNQNPSGTHTNNTTSIIQDSVSSQPGFTARASLHGLFASIAKITSLKTHGS